MRPPIDKGFLIEELTERREIGGDASALDALSAEVNALPEAAPQADLHALLERIEAVAPDAGLLAREPDDLDEIRRLRPEGPRTMALSLDDDELYDRVLGAWLARAAGCTLGKPVEGWPRKDIAEVLRYQGDWPLADYFADVDASWTGRRWHPSQEGCLRENITHMVRDDDTDYTLMGLLGAERFGPGITSDHIAELFLQFLPFHNVYTAERHTYRNLTMGIKPPESARLYNPDRQWIGAQIRADFWGYVAAGRPEFAAELAWRDARVTHVRNGIYGEMWAAASIAAAFATGDPVEAMKIGLSEIPAECMLAIAVRELIEQYDRSGDLEKTLDWIMEAYGSYHPVHTINNALLVAVGILDGKGDLGRTICGAVVGGWDTDCNGATAGSILGAAVGARSLPYGWVGVLNDIMETAISGVGGREPLRFSDLARRSVEQMRRFA